MQDSRERSGRDGRREHAHREDGGEVSRHEVLPAPLLPKIGAGIVLLILAGCQQPITSDQGTISIYFCPSACEEVFTEFVESGKAKCAFYDLDSYLYPSLEDDETIVFYKHHHGFGKRIYTEGRMHNKFCVAGDKVMTGSANPTRRGLNTNYNNILIIESESVSDNYESEFEEMKKGRDEKTKNTVINLSGTLIENYFCPEDDCEEKVLEELEKAEESIHFMTFTFTSDAIGDLLREKSKEIEVAGLMESFGMNEYSEYHRLKDYIPIGLETTEAMLHHKVFIIDNHTVVTGSYNPTRAGTEKNDENILIIHHPDIAAAYTKELTRLSQTF